ncbi:MAG: lactonase family protein [Propionibacteriaceae bacterium]
MSDSSSAGLGIHIGGYTQEMRGSSDGIDAYRWISAVEDEVEISHLGAIELVSPTFLARHPDRPLLFAVSESSPGLVSACTISDSDALTLINSVDSGGEGGCHVAVDPRGTHLLVAHYTEGSVATFHIGEDGTLSQAIDVHPFSGSGPDPERQDRSHAHQVLFDGDTVLVTDLGSDQVHRLELVDGRLHEAGEVQLPPGSGPRHGVVTGDHLVIACELSAQLWLGRRQGREWQQVAVVDASAATAPGTETEGRIYPSAIAVSGDQVFVANRGADTCAVFSLDRDQHTLTPVAEFPSGGRWPRDLVLSSDRLWIANQVSNVVSVFTRTDEGTMPAWTLDFEIPSNSPACVVLGPEGPPRTR